MLDEWHFGIVGNDGVMNATASDISERMNMLAKDAEVIGDGDQFTNARKLGHLLSRLRFQKGTKSKNARPWKVSRDHVEAMAKTHGIDLTPKENAENANNATMPSSDDRGLEAEFEDAE